MDAHGTILQELIRRVNWWYRQGKSSYEHAKLKVKSWHVETRARLARRRGDNVAARRYRSKALQYRRTLRDPGPALENVVALSALERERSLLGNAAEYLEEGKQICAEIDPTPAFREEVRALADAYEERGDDEAAAEWYFTGIYLARAVDPEFERRRSERHRRYLELADAPNTTANVYDLGLRNLLYGDDDLASECLAEAASRRDDLESSNPQYRLALAAGVGLLALDALGIAVADEREAIREAVSEERNRLSEPATALFDAAEGEEADPTEFDADADPRDIRLNLGQLETAAYAKLHGNLLEDGE